MRRSKTFIIALVIVTLVTISIGYGFFASPEPQHELYSKIGETIKNSKMDENTNSERILAETNGIPITVEEFELKSKLYLLEGYINNEEYDKVLKRIAKVKQLYKMSEDYGVNVSFEEAKKASLEERIAAEKDSNTNALMESYIQSLGISADEYWQQYHANELVLYLSITKLRSKIIEDAIAQNKLQKVEKDILIGTPKEYQKYIEDFEKEIENNIKIEIKDNEYKQKLKL